MRRSILFAIVFLVSLLTAETLHLGLNGEWKSPFETDDQVATSLVVNGKPAMLLSWDSNKHKWTEFWWDGTTTKTFQNFDKITVTLQGKLDGTCEPNRIALRFIDSQGEAFEAAPKKTDRQPNKDIKITYEVLASQSIHGWKTGKNAVQNSKIDLPLKFSGVAATYTPNSGKGTLTITDIQIDVNPKNANQSVTVQKPVTLAFDLETQNPVRIIEPTDKGYLFGIFFNKSEKEIHRFSATITTRDIDGNVIGTPFKKDCALYYNRRSFFPIPAPTKHGIYYTTADITFESGEKLSIQRSFAVAKLTRHTVPYRKGQFRFGVQIHWWPSDPDVWKKEMDVMAQIGVRFSRESHGIDYIMTSPDTFNYGFSDAHVDYALQHGITPVLILGGSHAQWAHDEKHQPGDKKTWNMRPNYAIWEKYCTAMYTHFRGRLEGFELWNEPDLEHFARFGLEEVNKLAEIADRCRRKCAPEMLLMSPGFCNFKNKDRIHEKIMDANKGVFDVHCWHGHGFYYQYRGGLEQDFFPMRKQIGIDKMPWYPHETGLTSTGTTEQVQAETLWKKILYSWSKNAIGYTWYDHRNDGFDPANPEHNYGIITRDFYPKAAYVAYNTLIGLYNGPTFFLKSLSSDPTYDAFLFTRPDALQLACWSNSKYNQGTRTLFTDAQSAEYVDMYGNATKLEIKKGLVIIPLSERPATVRLYGAKSCRLVDGVLTADTKKVVFSTRNQTVRATLKNIGDNPETFQLEVACPAGISTTFGKQAITVPAHGTETRDIPLIAEKDKVTPDTSILLKASSPSNGENILALPVNVISELKPDFAAKPNFILDRRDQTIELFDANPGEMHRLRTGNSDMNVKIYLAGTNQDFRLKVVVEDDIHSQPNKGEKIWQGDGLQIYMRFPSSPIIWQFGCALLDNGKTDAYVWTGERNNTILRDMKCDISRKGTITTYILSVPWTAFNQKADAIRKDGFAFSMLVNESDSGIRESWMRVSSGVADGITDAAYPLFKLK